MNINIDWLLSAWWLMAFVFFLIPLVIEECLEEKKEIKRCLKLSKNF